MSRFIDLVETFDFSTLESQSYAEKIGGLLKRFPKYENDDNFRTVLPHKFLKTADDYISVKLCTKGRYPIYGIYSRRDFDLVGVCVHGNIMYALDDCDLHPSLVPDLNVRKVCLGIRDSDLATRETPSYTKAFMCSAISTLSLGYTPEKKNEWCEAVVLLTGMTTQAVRFHVMRSHIEFGIIYARLFPYVLNSYDGRLELDNSKLAIINRWNKISKAIRIGDYHYVFSFYANNGMYSRHALSKYTAREKVALINDKDKRGREISRKRSDRWNGPLGNSIRKRKEEHRRRCLMEEEKERNMEETDNAYSERMHGFWYGSVDTCISDVASIKCLPRPTQMARANRFLIPATSHLVRLRDVLQVQRTLTSVHPAVKNVQNEGGLLAFFRGRSMMFENWTSSCSYLSLKMPKPNPSLCAALRSIGKCTLPVFTAATVLGGTIQEKEGV